LKPARRHHDNSIKLEMQVPESSDKFLCFDASWDHILHGTWFILIIEMLLVVNNDIYSLFCINNLLAYLSFMFYLLMQTHKVVSIITSLFLCIVPMITFFGLFLFLFYFCE